MKFFLSLIRFYLIIFACVSSLEKTEPKYIYILLRPVSKNILPMFSSRTFIISGLTFRPFFFFNGFLFFYLFIYFSGCAGSSFLCEGFL